MNNKVKIVTDDSIIYITGDTHTHTRVYIIVYIVRKLYYKYNI